MMYVNANRNSIFTEMYIRIRHETGFMFRSSHQNFPIPRTLQTLITCYYYNLPKFSRKVSEYWGCQCRCIQENGEWLAPCRVWGSWWLLWCSPLMLLHDHKYNCKTYSEIFCLPCDPAYRLCRQHTIMYYTFSMIIHVRKITLKLLVFYTLILYLFLFCINLCFIVNFISESAPHTEG